MKDLRMLRSTFSLLVLLVLLAPGSAGAWAVVNDSGLDLDGTVFAPALGYSVVDTFTVNSGNVYGCDWFLSACNPPTLERDSALVILLTSTDGESFECENRMRGDGVVRIRAQPRTLPTPPNLYCSSTFNEAAQAWPPPIGITPWIDLNGNGVVDAEAFEDASDPFALASAPGSIPTMDAANRMVRFLATGDPQYDNAFIDGDGNTSGNAADSDATLFEAASIMTADLNYRGMIVNGDLTQNARGDNDFNAIQSSDELDAYRAAIGPERHMFFEGLGNHDIESTGASSAPDDMPEFVSQKPRNTRRTLHGVPHYSWDWHDVHFVQLNVFPANIPSSLQPGLDPQDARDFLQTDLATHVGNSGRPVVLNHHYGFDGGVSPLYWTAAEKAAYWNAIRDYNVIAIFTGHAHVSAPGNSWVHPFHQPDSALSFPITALARPDGRSCLPTFNGAAARGSDSGGDVGAFLDVLISSNTVSVDRRGSDGSSYGSLSYSLGTLDVPNSETTTVYCPEPGQLAMLLPGLGLLTALRRRRAARS